MDSKQMGSKHEDAWIEGWSDLLEILKQEPDLLFVTSDWIEISEDDVLGLIQDEAYEGYRVNYGRVWYTGRPALQFYRTNPIA
jgi:hypothetical protein